MRVVPQALEQRWMGLSGNVRGALWMIASGLIFTVMAIAIRILGHRLDSFQIAFFRCLIGFIAILPLVGAYGIDVLQTRSLKIHALRGLFGLISMFASYYAIARIPLASYTALSFTRPLFATILAVVVLHEIVRWRRWTATLVGFVGVLVMVRPGAETFNSAALFALMDSLSIAFLITLVKRLPPGETALGMMFYFGVFSTIAALPPALFVWQWPTALEWSLLILIGVLGALSQSFWIRAYRAGEASVVAPIDYLRLLFAGIAGYLAFAETVDLWTVAGAAIIVASTIYIARREARVRRAKAAEAATATGGAAAS
ncbi:MAG TPA: DMT family transporter [Hypericibacter adhaerens]|jgi:drug/metabolite transporter (DMT)-like permease|uniref:DMT family transporter n=1 Tax=Hypericibacter adhaerens TaxID=2602016 RepID=UPI001245D9CD|nr:DMT family transporter [Hypericibacter adhaerens]HWA43769.1 DMT family transporter [Hypericibacter adhaerens]